MRQRLIATSDSSGIPSVQVPFTNMWDLVEYLSYDRVFASYRYEASHFTVAFPRLDLDSAQRVLDGWSKVRVPELV